jgi:RHS repeat-associated protein
MLDNREKAGENNKKEPSQTGAHSGPSLTSSPTISLPKGGGAIRGIGEKFAANPVTGTGSMTVPITTSPGRSGFGPQLSLSYDSGAGNGPFGLGWNLSLPSITRKTDKGLPRYQDAGDPDVFILSGAEDLVPEFKKNEKGEWVKDGGNFVREEEVRGDYLVRRYRPRIEGLFARIERWTNANNPTDVFWRSISKDNVTTLYGKTIESRIADPSDESRIFSWLICESYDDKGNAIHYGYKSENSDLVQLSAASEKNRSRSAQRYLKRIKYGNKTPHTLSEDLALRNDWLFEVVFDYGEHYSENIQGEPTGVHAEDTLRQWGVREDPFSTYRAGFEVRTYRLCHRVLMFHHFPTELGPDDYLVRATHFVISQTPAASFITAVTQSGYKLQPNGTYLKKSLPPVEFDYSKARIDETVREAEEDSLENLPYGLDGLQYQWVDLDGEGLSGVLTEQGGAWFYKRNLSALPVAGDNGKPAASVRFAPLERLPTIPAPANLSRGQQLLDLTGNGQLDVVDFDGPIAGFFERTTDEGWETFRSFTSLPNVAWNDPNLKFVDLTGDGHADILITEDEVLTWYPSLAEEGFGPAERVRRTFDEEMGPRLVFADGTQSIYLSDLSGDGLTDLVRIRNGQVCYWPNLGYGRFGAKVTMDHAPWFEEPDQFDQKRIRLADIDGSGAIDIIYLGADGVRLYFNQSGNRWSDARRLSNFPTVDNLSSVQVADLLGNGTACLVWSSPLPAAALRSIRYIDLMGGQKPNLLIKTVNNLGGETRVHYTPSTKFYLADKYAGKPWITKLPFPVHVVEKVETFDHISRNRFVSRYSYHHGYFDGDEREFRGFGMVEQWDIEAFEDYVAGVQRVDGTQILAPELNQPPVTTLTWYHTGAFLDQARILHQFRHEYYQQKQHMPESSLPAGLASDDEMLESLRALKGLPLRQEIYSYDGSLDEQHPYTVVENNVEIRLLQPRGKQRHAVFFPVVKQSISLNYERKPTDPRIAHSLGLELDEYGNARKSCSVVYRRKVADASLPEEVIREQQKLYITYAETDYTSDIEHGTSMDTYRLRVPYAARSYEVTGISPTSTLFQFDDIKAKISGTAEIDYDDMADGLTPQKRLLCHGRTLYLDNNLNPLPLGQWDTLGLGHQSYQLAFTPGVTAAHYVDRVTDADFAGAGYLHFNGDANWWIPSGTAIYPANPGDHFYLPIGTKDPLNMETMVTFDQYDLLVEKVEVKQALWNVLRAVNDYSVLGPVLLMDANKNRSAVEIDALGMVVKTAIMGKAGSADGDNLADPTTRIEYELFNWMNNRKPNFVHSFAREKHGVANPRWQESYIYSNGRAEVAMVKAQVNPGKAFKVNPDGTKVEVDADSRWVGTGRTILNNKGTPVKQYEPYFSTTHAYEDERALREIGVSPVLYYDAVGRNIRTLFPNGTFARIEFDPWKQKLFDTNDTVKQTQWYADRGSPDPATQPEPLNNPERRAAWLAAKHADTPGSIHFDSLGRPVYAISDYGGGKTAALRSESDLTGRISKMFDQEQREVASAFVGMASTTIVNESAEKGRRWTFQNVLGALVKAWDEHGRKFRAEYDNLHRPISMFVQEIGQAEILFNYVVYGDRLANAEQLNLLGTAHQIFDQGGMMRLRKLDFKGNPVFVDRVLAKDYTSILDWSALASQPNYASIQAASNPALETSEVFTAGSEYDALNRPTQVTLPDGTVILPRYNEANFLASLQAKIRGQGNVIEFLKGQDFDAKGQRQFAHYGNEVLTRYFYDAHTFRLTKLLTYKSGDDPDTQELQDLRFTYDPIGNITQIHDDAQQTHYFNNAVVKAESLYEYDSIYQLIRASGREHAGIGNNTLRTHNGLDFVPQLPHANNAEAVRTYIEEYEYDLLGNIKILKHRFQPQPGIGNGWTRHYRYAFEDNPANCTNRLTSTNLPGDSAAGPYSGTYDYDAYSNMIRMPHLPTMEWNFMDQLRQVELGGGGTAHYVYGLGGERLRKVIERNGNLKLEWIFLGAIVIFRRRRRDTNDLRLERWTVHIGDNTGHFAQIDTKTRDDDNHDPDNPLNLALIRYQYGNHLGSAVLEMDVSGNPISYEEYHPYGTTAYRSAKPGFDISLKRYRFSGKEQDDETGLYYFHTRYYVVWLGRWASSDPAGFGDGLNLFRYCRNSPINHKDPFGTDTVPFSGFTGRETYEDLQTFAREHQVVINDPNFTPDNMTSENRGRFYEPNSDNPDGSGGYWHFEIRRMTDNELHQLETGEGAVAVDPPAPDASATETPTPPPAPPSNASETAAGDPSITAERPSENNEEGFWSSIVSGKQEAGFWKGLIPVLGSLQNANYHLANGNWVRGIAYTALAISDVFLIRSLATGVVKLAARGAVALKGIGGTFLKEASSQGVGSGTKLVTKLQRFFVQDLKNYNPDASTIYRVLRQHFQISTKKGSQSMFEMHHWLIQHGWYGGSNPVSNQFVRRALQKLGDGGWNLIPLPAPINNALGKSGLATMSFAHNLFAGVIHEFQWTANNMQELYQAATME